MDDDPENKTTKTVKLSDSADGAATTETAHAGSRVGRYIILEHLGSGGMGAVYKAYDPVLERQIALKVLLRRSEQSGAQQRERDRLLREAHALARLTHPNVVAVHDVGIADDIVFMALELVQGQTLNRWLKEKSRSPREILRVMLDAGDGLAAAHAVGIVHRDVKPDNIVIGEDGRARVLDFGLARTSGSPPAEDSETVSHPQLEKVTRVGAIVGTPSYMAPEQFRNVVDAKSDQFGFCITLYKALAGRRPFSEEELRAGKLGEPAPPLPGRRIPRPIARALRRGLSAQPEHRFTSLAELLTTLRRSPMITWTRVLVAVLALATLGSVAVATTRHAPLSSSGSPCAHVDEGFADAWSPTGRSALERAFTNSGRAHAKESFARVASNLDAFAGEWKRARIAACEASNVRHERSATFYDAQMRCLDHRRDAVRELVHLLSTTSDADAFDHAVPGTLEVATLEPCQDEAALLAAAPPPPNPDARARVADLTRRLDALEVHYQTGRYSEGLQEAQLITKEARSLAYDPLLARALWQQAQLEEKLGQSDADAQLVETMTVAARAKDLRLIARAWALRIRVVGTIAGKGEAALALREPAKLAMLVADDQEASAQLARQTGELLSNLAKYDEAAPLLDEYVDRCRKLHGPRHPCVSDALTLQGTNLAQRGDLDGAKRMLEQAVTLTESLLGPTHPALAEELGNLGALYTMIHDPVGAEPIFARAVALEEQLGRDTPTLAYRLDSLGVAQLTLKKSAQAVKQFERALEIQNRVLPHDHPDRAWTLSNLGDAHLRAGEYEAAYERLIEARDLWEKVSGKDHPDVALVYENLGELACRRHRFDEAHEAFSRAVTIISKSMGPHNPRVAHSYNLWGKAYLNVDENKTARWAFERALAEVKPDDLPKLTVAQIKFNIAMTLPHASARAQKLAREALSIASGDDETEKRFREEVTEWLKPRAIDSNRR